MVGSNGQALVVGNRVGASRYYMEHHPRSSTFGTIIRLEIAENTAVVKFDTGYTDHVPPSELEPLTGQSHAELMEGAHGD